MTPRPLSVHIAAPPSGLLQLCTLCYHILANATDWSDEQRRSVSSAGALADPPTWYRPAVRVAIQRFDDTDDVATHVLPADRPLNDDEMYCKAFVMTSHPEGYMTCSWSGDAIAVVMPTVAPAHPPIPGES